MYIANERRRATRRILWQWGQTIDNIQRLERELESYRCWAYDARITLRAQNIDGMPHGNGNKQDLSDVVERIIRRSERYEEQVKRIETEIEQRLKIRNTIESLIAQLRPETERVLTMRYKENHNFRYIAMKMNYDERQIQRIEAKAVDFIADNLEKMK